jgi:uncharacterized damage-inducible protein DinB
MSVESLVLKCSVDSLREFRERIEVCLGKLTDDQIWSRGHENENAVGNLILHLCGNVRQWIISGLGGAEDHRERHLEFEARRGESHDSLISKMRATVDEAITVIEGLSAGQLTANYSIQNYDVSGVYALLHVVEHFAQHTGQIIFATKLLTGENLGFYRNLDPK